MTAPVPSRPWVIDAHNHVGSLQDTGIGGLGGAGSAPGLDSEIADRAAVMGGRGVDQAVLIASHGYLRPDGIADTRRVNDSVASYAQSRPDLFPAGVGVVEPLYGERGLAELDRAAGELRLRGISFHTRFQGVSIDSPWVRRYLQRMGELGLVPFVHAVGESAAEALWKVDVLAGDFPDLPMVVLDAFSTFEQSQFVPVVAERRPHLLFDTATAHGLGFVADLVDRCGASRVAFGSDLYSGRQSRPGLSHLLDDILAWDVPRSDLDAIVAGNIRRVLHLDPLS
ncbi:MAG: amidohydrolase [Acidimicrobiales bacterium]|nr:amidohydrolase [Acidimicrobiales bacterium]